VQDDLTADDFSSMSASVLYTMLKSKSSWPLHKAIHAKREDVVFLYLIEFNNQVHFCAFFLFADCNKVI